MATEYTNLASLQRDYPLAVQVILDENSIQHPNAKLVRAVVGKPGLGGEWTDIMAAFDCGTQDKLLWVWVIDVNDPFIDEYYEMPTADVMNELNKLY